MNPPPRALARTEQAPEPQLSVAQHLEELRRRIFICLAAVLVTSSLAMAFAERIIGWLMRPAQQWLPSLVFFGPMEALMAHVQVALAAGAAASLPIVFYQIWAFVRTGLRSRERSLGLMVVGWGTALFVAGAALAYWLVLPAVLRFLLTFGEPYLEPVISVSHYLAFVLSVLITCGLVFELPLVIVMLVRLGVVAPSTLRRQRGLALIIILVMAAVLSPTTDAVSLLVMTLPMVLLYEVSIIVASWSPRPRA